MVKKRSPSDDSLHKKKRKHQSPLTQQGSSELLPKQPPRRPKRKSKKALKEEAEERRLTALLFGGGGTCTVDEGGGEEEDSDQVEQKKSAKDESPSLQFQFDRTGASDNEEEDDDKKQLATRQHPLDDDGERSDDDDSSSVQDGPAWFDEDDDDVRVDLMGTDRLKKLRTSRSDDQPLSGTELQQRLRARYKSTLQATAQTEWARLDDKDEDEEDALLQSSSQPLLLQGASSSSMSSSRMPPNILNVMRCPDANQAEYNQAVVQAVNFHPGSDPDRPLLLTAGLDKTLRFFQVGSETSDKIHGIHFPKLPIYSAHFLGDTGKVVVSGRRPFFYLYDSVAGKLDHVPRIMGREEKSLEKCVPSPDGKLIAFVGNDGYVLLVDVQSKQWLANLKMNGSVRAITWTPDGEYILASGSDGDVYRWEVRSRRCVERFTTQDGTITSYLAASSRRHLAVGSESGVVGLYNDEIVRHHDVNSSRTPIKSIMNLHTSADMVRFNHDGQILAMSSRREKQGLKLLHVPTATVFSNWPTSKTPLQYVWSMDFSPQSKYLAVGNDKGKCLLYQLRHYCQIK